MLNLNCAICAEQFAPSDDVNVTACGHMFHIICLNQWLERSKTCPQCRNRCTDRNIIRVYFNFASLDSSHIDIVSLQEQLDNSQLQLKIKENELRKAMEEINKSKETQKKCMKTIAVLEKDLQSKNFLILNYTEKTKMLESQVKIMENLRKECKNLKEQIEAMEGVNTLLTSTMSDAEKLLKNESDPKILSVWVATLKRELRICENRKADMRNVLKVLQSDLRKEIEQKKLQEEKINQLESENYQLSEKIKCLEVTLGKKQNRGGDIEKSENNESTAINTTNNSNTGISPAVPKINNSMLIKDNIKKIEESSSPYLNIKSCNVLLPPLLIKTTENRINNSVKVLLGDRLKISPVKKNSGAIRKTKSDICEKYSIFKKTRLDLATKASNCANSNYVYNGFGGSDRVDVFDDCFSTSDDDCEKVTTSNHQAGMKSKQMVANSIHNRLKTGGLRNFKISK